MEEGNLAGAATGAISAEKSLAMRDKLWPERDIEQKLSALRSEVVRLLHLNENLQQQVAFLVEHQHGPRGELLTPMPGGRINSPIGYQRNHVPTALRDKE